LFDRTAAARSERFLSNPTIHTTSLLGINHDFATVCGASPYFDRFFSYIIVRRDPFFIAREMSRFKNGSISFRFSNDLHMKI